MGFCLCQRIKQSNLTLLSHQIKRHYLKVSDFTALNCPPAVLATYGFDRSSHVRRIPDNSSLSVRHFAAPIQAVQKKEEKGYSGPRLNEEITAKYVRLVLDEGHFVVSIHEAAERARKLKLDLVEVQRHANPPVCKIMDFHREQYKQAVKKKERIKSKSDVTLRSGDFKEVRFYGKTELKDLKVKSDMIQKLMERGYRVKCMAMASQRRSAESKTDCGDDESMSSSVEPMNQKNRKEGEDLGALLSRLTSMMGETAVVESGPWVEKKQAFVVVRHAKFGPAKKGKTKKLTDLQDAIASSKFEDSKKPASPEKDVPIKTTTTTWSEIDSTDDFAQVFDSGNNADSGCSISEMRGGFVDRLPVENRYKMSKSVGADALIDPSLRESKAIGRLVEDHRRPNFSPGTSHRSENRYQRSESHKINAMTDHSFRYSNPNPPVSSPSRYSNSERGRTPGEDDCDPNLSAGTYRRNENRHRKSESNEIDAQIDPFLRGSKPGDPVSSAAVSSNSDRRRRIAEDHRRPPLSSEEACRRTGNRHSKGESDKIDAPIYPSPSRNAKLNAPIAPSPGYGIFSSGESAPGKLDATPMDKKADERLDNFARDSSSSGRLRNSTCDVPPSLKPDGLPPSDSRPGQGRWGIFSGDS